MRVSIALFLVLTLAGIGGGRAAVKTETIEYKHGDVVLEGILATDDAAPGPRPGVLVIHEWTGVGDYVEGRVEQLAALGFVAFGADLYGKGARPEVDKERIAAIGYCFGGGAVLELARGGAELAGVVSFHGNLDTPEPKDAERIRAKVLVCHGAADPYVPEEQVDAFRGEMDDAGVDWQMIFYGGAVHSFTNPAAGSDPSTGAAYDADADRRSWEAMRIFFAEIFR